MKRSQCSESVQVEKLQKKKIFFGKEVGFFRVSMSAVSNR